MVKNNQTKECEKLREMWREGGEREKESGPNLLPIMQTSNIED